MAGAVLIAGRDFCGSTILSRILNVIPGVVSLGETHWMVDDPKKKGVCSVHGSGCNRIRRVLSQNPTSDNLFEKLSNEFSEKRWIVSSDKFPSIFRRFMPLHKTKAIILFKSPFAFAASDKHNKRKYPVKKSIISFVESYKECLSVSNLYEGVVYVNLDDVVCDSSSEINRICNVLGIGKQKANWDFCKIRHHNIGGNGMARESKMLYIDKRWIDELSMNEKMTVALSRDAQYMYMNLLNKSMVGVK